VEVEMDEQTLKQRLLKIDGRGYKAYKEIAGSYIFPRFTLFIDYIQGDPFAAPSRLRAAVSQPLAGFDPSLYANPARKTALEDFLARAFDRAIAGQVKGHRGTGKSGLVAVDAGGQEILMRTAAVVSDNLVEVRFSAGLPASGRRCLGKEAQEMLLKEIPRVVDRSLYCVALDAGELDAHIKSAEDQQWLRGQLAGMGLVAFVADGSVLPRESGISGHPLSQGRVISFKSPEELKVEVELPNRGRTSGMGIPEGVTLITGGGYHGKSTLLKALERGVYDHIPGDGRELVATRGDAVKIRAEDGRRVEKVDISPFISNLPFGRDTVAFCTENASGSTSQAANIIEALELGSRLLLIDEDTSATNFMIRDEMMQRLIDKEQEPITPFIDQVHNLLSEHGVSTVLVMGGSGDYFEVADSVIAMESYLPRVVTGRAREIVAARKDKRIQEGSSGFGPLRARRPQPAGINPRRGRREKVTAKGLGTIIFGREAVDLGSVEQLVDASQTRAIGDMIRYGLARGYIDGSATLKELVDRLMADIDDRSLDIVSPYIKGGREAGDDILHAENGAAGINPGEYALPRPYEVAAMLNRLRSLRVEQ
jgi:predicted ABC-class ATPase